MMWITEQNTLLTEVKMDRKPHSVQRSIARDYYIDALDFIERFDILFQHSLTRTGRVKRFLDLTMGCECALKAHIFLSLTDQTADQIYWAVRDCSHDIGKLSDLANFTPDRKNYEYLKSKLQSFSVFLRYSLNANSTLFPILENWDAAKINYDSTIGNSTWVTKIRQSLTSVMEELSQELGGWVDCDPSEIFAHADTIREILLSRRRPRK